MKRLRTLIVVPGSVAPVWAPDIDAILAGAAVWFAARPGEVILRAAASLCLHEASTALVVSCTRYGVRISSAGGVRAGRGGRLVGHARVIRVAVLPTVAPVFRIINVGIVNVGAPAFMGRICALADPAALRRLVGHR